jgi:hypothetical protein
MADHVRCSGPGCPLPSIGGIFPEAYPLDLKCSSYVFQGEDRRFILEYELTGHDPDLGAGHTGKPADHRCRLPGTVST